MYSKEISEISHLMTHETMDSYIAHETDLGGTDNMLRRYRAALKTLYTFLPESDKNITKERLLSWRRSLEDQGYASSTILNYVKHINRYLDFVGCGAIRFTRGKAKDITGMSFGRLTAIEPTGAKERGNNVWLFRCQCGNTVTLPATRVLTGNTLSCGCSVVESLKASRKYYNGTSLVQSMTDNTKSTRSVSGYTGVTPKRDKWQAYITYKGVHYSLGCYNTVDEAVLARARAKQLVMEDAAGLLAFYTELEKGFPQIPSKNTFIKKEFSPPKWKINNTPLSAAKRSDNKSGYTGVSFSKGKWVSRICYQGTRYFLGSFDELDDAIAQRRAAEALLIESPDNFVLEYSNKFSHHHI